MEAHSKMEVKEGPGLLREVKLWKLSETRDTRGEKQRTNLGIISQTCFLAYTPRSEIITNDDDELRFKIKMVQFCRIIISEYIIWPQPVIALIMATMNIIKMIRWECTENCSSFFFLALLHFFFHYPRFTLFHEVHMIQLRLT